MIVEPRPLIDITQEAIRVLLREMGIVNVLRFLNQYTIGYGNFTNEREQLFGCLTLGEIIAETKKEQPTAE